MKEELLKGLSEEQIAKIKACNSSDEYLALAKEIGLELSEDELESFSGGMTDRERREYYRKIKCPSCGADAKNLTSDGVGYSQIGPTETIRCKLCGCVFDIKYPH